MELKILTVFTIISLIIVSSIGDPTPEQLLLADVYANFSAGVLDALAKDFAGSPSPSLPPPPPGPMPPPLPVTVSSLFGLTHILAVLHEKPFPASVPVFESLLAVTPKNLPQSYALLASTTEKDPEIKLSSLIFTSEKLEMTKALSDLKVEMVNLDLKAADAVSTINNQLAKKIETPLDEPFIPKDETLSPAAVAFITDTLHLSESWPTPVKKIPGVKFNGKEVADMIEIVGNFQVSESNKAVEVFIPFKNPKRGISLVLPYNIEAVLKGDFGDMKPINFSSVRIQLPAHKVAIRSSQASLASSSNCQFKKEANFLQLFDELSYLSFDQDKFEAISISAAQINNAATFKAELAKGNKGKAIDGTPIENHVVSGNPEKPIPFPIGPPPPTAPGAEKLIVFNHPFSWSILDENLGPLFSGTLESLSFLKDHAGAATAPPTTPPKTNGPIVFGSQPPLPFEKCL